jgi:hypothetical protein
MGLPIERFVFAGCFFFERTWLEIFAPMRAGCCVGKAKTTETSCKTHFAYRFLVFIRSFMLIALDESFQDWLRVKGRTGVHFQHAANDQLIGIERGL